MYYILFPMFWSCIEPQNCNNWLLFFYHSHCYIFDFFATRAGGFLALNFGTAKAFFLKKKKLSLTLYLFILQQKQVVFSWFCLLSWCTYKFFQWSKLLSTWKGIAISAAILLLVTVIMHVFVLFSQSERSTPAKVAPSRPRANAPPAAAATPSASSAGRKKQQ